MLTYTVAHEWAKDSSGAVMDGLKNFNAAFIGTDHPKQLAIIVRDEEQRIVAGLLGETRWDWMYIGWVWVSDGYRANGIGTDLMKRIEREAVVVGCHSAHLTTLDFQAKGFYEKLGYEVFAALEDYPRGHTRFMMKKKLRSLKREE